MTDMPFGYVPRPQREVIDLWDAGCSYEDIARRLNVTIKFVRETVCRLDDRTDSHDTDKIRAGSLLLEARIAQCFPHRPDMRRRAA